MLVSAMMIQASSFSVMAEGEVLIHVSTTGTSAGTGTAEDPVNSLQSATELAKTYSEKDIKIVVHGGEYKLDKTLTMQNINASYPERNITYKAYGDGEVVFSGATELDNDKFEHITDASVLKRIQRNARTKVVQYDLSQEGIDYIDSDPSLPYLFVNDSMKTMARYPNDGHLVATEADGTREFTFSDLNGKINVTMSQNRYAPSPPLQ